MSKNKYKKHTHGWHQQMLDNCLADSGDPSCSSLFVQR